jgi:uncharacterized protein (TIGR03435 family)
MAGGDPRGPGARNIARSKLNTRTLIAIAYNLRFNSDRVLGGPGWLDTKWYVIDGKIPDELFAEMQKMTPEQRSNQVDLMWQALLADRFRLKVHFETREMPIYELVVAKGGPKLTPAKEPPPAPTTAPSEPGNPLRPEDMRQGVRVLRKTRTITEMTVKAEPMDAWVSMPFLGLGRPVVNKTGLKGKYDFTLNWTQDDLSASPALGGLAAPSESDGQSLFTAMQEQLGLKLVPTKGPVEVIIIDHIELPSEN